jgi:hypothetical protein
MTRTQYGGLIAAIIFSALFLAWAMWPAPNLDGLSGFEKCKYASWYRTHGGSYQACYDAELEAAKQRLRSSY